MKKKYLGLHELYTRDPDLADEILWGRQAKAMSRRGFLQKSALIAMSTILGAKIVYANHFPAGMIPAGLAHRTDAFALPGKHPDMVILNDRPVNAETPAHLLNDKRTPANLLFVRNNGLPPALEDIDLDTWTLTIAGESAKNEKSYTIAELKQRFKEYTYDLVLECGGNGRKEFNPPAKGNQWSIGGGWLRCLDRGSSKRCPRGCWRE